MKTTARAVALTLPLLAQAQGAEIFKGADLALGALSPKTNASNATPARSAATAAPFTDRKAASARPHPHGHIHNAGLLRRTVENCSSGLSVQLFPDEVTATAAVLNRDHCKFK